MMMIMARALILFACCLISSPFLYHASAAPDLINYEIPTGDLLFLRPPLSASSELDKAILATGKATISWIRAQGIVVHSPDISLHVAMAWRALNGSLYFIQAIPPRVVITPASEFFRSIPPGTTTFHGAVPSSWRNTSTVALDASRIALKQVGKPYASDFEPPPNKFYCSSLIEFSYKHAMQKRHLFFNESFKLIFVPRHFWTHYYEEMGVPLPINVTGSNPTLLLHSPLIRYHIINSTTLHSNDEGKRYSDIQRNISVPMKTIKIWHIVWTGGQSNSVGTNSQTAGYPTWPTSPRIQNFCSYGNCEGTFRAAKVPLYNEVNVGFSQTFANLLLPTLPDDHGIVLLNTGVGGTGFQDGRWAVPDGDLALRSIAAMNKLVDALPAALGGNFSFHSMLWHQGEDDAGDNQKQYQATYCHYLEGDMGPLIDFLREKFPGATPGTPFVDGGMLPYWVDAVHGTDGVMNAIYAVNTSRPCTGTANSRIFPDYFPGTHTPDGEPRHRSGVTGDVIHFNATQAVLMGYEYFDAYQRAVTVQTIVPSAKTGTCNRSSSIHRYKHTTATVTQCAGGTNVLRNN